MNTWPNGYPHSMDQSQHEVWNASNYPGTRQLCEKCEAPTGRCEEDTIIVWGQEVCESCRDEVLVELRCEFGLDEASCDKCGCADGDCYFVSDGGYEPRDGTYLCRDCLQYRFDEACQ